MSWTRGNIFRVVISVVLAGYLVLNVMQGDWVWVALIAVVLALNVWSVTTSLRAPTEPITRMPPAPAQTPTPDDEHDVDGSLAELLDVPAVAAAWAAGPPAWRQVSFRDDDLGPLPATEAAEYVWVSKETEEAEMGADWSLSVADELIPYLDLDVDEQADPLVATLLAHPAVAEAWHADRERYEVTLSSPMESQEFAALASAALVAHHLDAVRRLEPRPSA